MNFNKLLKFTLSGLVLAATATAYAQVEGATEPKVVTLGDGTQKTWTDFVNALNDPTTIKGTADAAKLNEAQDAYNKAVVNQKEKDSALKAAQKAYNDAETQLSDWKEELDALKTIQSNHTASYTLAIGQTEKVTVGWLKTAQTAAQKFLEDYNKNDQSSTLLIYYKEYTSSRNKIQLTISFVDPKESGWTSATQEEFYQAFENNTGKKVSLLYIYFGKKDDGGYNYVETADGALNVSTYTGNSEYILSQAVYAIDNLASKDNYNEYKNQSERTNLEKLLADDQKNIDNKTAQINGYTQIQEGNVVSKQVELRNAITNAQADKDEADGVVETAEKTLADEQSKYDEALSKSQNDAIKSYKTVTLTGNVTATTAIADFDGTIIGGGHVITLNGIDALFSNFNGSLANVAINGNVFQAQGNNASYTNVAYWNGTSGAFRDESNNRTFFDKLSKLGYAAREYFGVDFANGKLAPRTDESVVYNITEYGARNYQRVYYVQKNGDNLRTDDNAIYSIPENMFAKTDYAALADYANMIYDGVCKKAVIKDGTTEFYCPEDITVETVEYNREFKTGMNALCLPFELEKNALNERLGGEKIDVLCTYDKETSDKFWFKRKAGVIAANTPVLLLAKEDFTLSFKGEVRMKKTPEELTVIDQGDLQDPSKSYGLFMKANSTELQGATEYHKIYGLKKDGKFAPAASNKVNFPALRMVIYSNNTTESGVNAAPRHIGILDEKGVDITDQYTAVENVYTEASGITVTAGAGEINITSDADYGKVPVYTMDGKVAAMADVTAGTTTVSVQSGLYIVMGKKVIVK